MKKLLELIDKKKKICAGIMTGTSVDAVDIAIIEVEGAGLNLRFSLLGFYEHPIDQTLKKLILKNSIKQTSNVEEICKLNFVLPRLYAEALENACHVNNLKITDIDLIGSHGQTIQHLPGKQLLCGYNAQSTLQIGDPSVLAKLTGVVTIGNFRAGDVALGGEGAPLVPFFDYLVFRSETKNRLLLNIGGIANITLIKARATVNEVRAFDVGPGNMLIDFLADRFFNKRYDEDGLIAKKGKLNIALFDAIKDKDNFVEALPPKTTGREHYGENFLDELLEKFPGILPEDWIRTVTYYTAFAIYRNYEKFILPYIKVDELLVSGGGANNKFLFSSLKELFFNLKVKKIKDKKVQADSKEAICFAILANETIAGNPTNIPNVTGALRPTILGEICLP